MSATISRSPAGFIAGGKAWGAWRKAVREGKSSEEIGRLKGEAVDKLARPVVGTTILATFGALAKSGYMTGSGPTDHREKNALKQGGWQPYSFAFEGEGGKKVYVPFNRFEPVSALLGFAADMAEASDAKRAGDFADKALGSVVENLTSKTYLQGLIDVAEAISEPKQKMGYYLGRLSGSLVPKAMRSRIPGLSETLPARRSGTGETIERPGNAVTQLLSPVQPSVEKENAAYQQRLVDLEAVPSAPRREITVKGRKVQLMEEEYKILQDADEATTKELMKLTERKSFERLAEEMRRSIIKNAYERRRSAARNKIIGTLAFRRRALARRSEAVR